MRLVSSGFTSCLADSPKQSWVKAMRSFHRCSSKQNPEAVSGFHYAQCPCLVRLLGSSLFSVGIHPIPKSLTSVPVTLETDWRQIYKHSCIKRYVHFTPNDEDLCFFYVYLTEMSRLFHLSPSLFPARKMWNLSLHLTGRDNYQNFHLLKKILYQAGKILAFNILFPWY